MSLQLVIPGRVLSSRARFRFTSRSYTANYQPRLTMLRQRTAKSRPIGATAWSAVEGREYDDVAEKDAAKKKDVAEVSDAELAPDSMLMYLYETRKTHEPGFRDERIENALARQKRIVDN